MAGEPRTEEQSPFAALMDAIYAHEVALTEKVGPNEAKRLAQPLYDFAWTTPLRLAATPSTPEPFDYAAHNRAVDDIVAEVVATPSTPGLRERIEALPITLAYMDGDAEERGELMTVVVSKDAVLAALTDEEARNG